MLTEKEQQEIRTQAKILLEIAKNYESYSPKIIAEYVQNKATEILKNVDR